MVDMDDDFVTEGLVIFTEALDDFEYYQLWKVFILSSDWPSVITLVLGLKHSIQKHSICEGYFSCQFYYTVIPPSCKMNDL